MTVKVGVKSKTPPHALSGSEGTKVPKRKCNKAGAYDSFGSIGAAKRYYKRCRRLQMFILTDACVSRTKLTCAHCGKPLTVKEGNRCEYHPEQNMVLCYHYVCSMESLMETIFSEEFMARCGY